MGLKTLEVINAIQAEHKLVMLECVSGKVFWVVHHYRYADHKKEGLRVYVGKGAFKGQYKYITDQLKTL